MEVRSYSRYSRKMSDDRVTKQPGQVSRRISPQPDFMGRVGVGVQEADGDGVDAKLVQAFSRPADARFVQRRQFLTLGVEPFRHFE